MNANPPASTFQMLGLQECTNSHGWRRGITGTPTGQQPPMLTRRDRVMTHPGDRCRCLRAGTPGYGNRDKHGGIPQGRGDLVWGLNYQKPRREVLSHSAGQTLRSQNQNRSRYYLLTQKIATRHSVALSSRPGLILEEQGQAGRHHTQARRRRKHPGRGERERRRG